MALPWWIYLIIGLVVYSAILDFDNLRDNPQDQIINTIKGIPGKVMDIVNNKTTEDTETIQESEDQYLGKPRIYEEFDCTTDEHCNFNLDACNNLCKCNLQTGECYIQI